jgi:AraC-like DNA-binding protein
MVDGAVRIDVPLGVVAWLHVSADSPTPGTVRPRTGPLGARVSPLRSGGSPFFFQGARLRSPRCIWSAATVRGAELHRPARSRGTISPDGVVNLLARIDAEGSVFDQFGPSAGTLRVYDPFDEIREQFVANTHVFTLLVPLTAVGLEPSLVRAMRNRAYELSPFQTQLLRGALGLLLVHREELRPEASLGGLDHYLTSLAALLLATSVNRSGPPLAQTEQIRVRSEAIIDERATDPDLTPAHIAAQLNISVRQLYRAFSGRESPAARIRRRRLERAAEILRANSGPGQVERVALECGFASAEYFSRAFRREFGVSPRAYRSSHRADTVHSLVQGGRAVVADQNSSDGGDAVAIGSCPPSAAG